MEHSEYKSSSSGLVLQLHPLVLLNVSDHWTRMRMSAGGSSNRQDENGNTNKSKDNGTAVGSPRVVGCLLGTQHGRVVEIVNSFEMVFDESEKIDVGQAGISSSSKSNDKSQIGIKIDEEFLRRKQDQCMGFKSIVFLTQYVPLESDADRRRNFEFNAWYDIAI